MGAEMAKVTKGDRPGRGAAVQAAHGHEAGAI